MTVLSNEYATLSRNGDSILLAGIDDPNGFADQKTPEALAEEAVTVTDIALAPAEQDRTRLTVQLEYQGTDLSVSLVI